MTPAVIRLLLWMGKVFIIWFMKTLISPVMMKTMMMTGMKVIMILLGELDSV